MDDRMTGDCPFGDQFPWFSKRRRRWVNIFLFSCRVIVSLLYQLLTIKPLLRQLTRKRTFEEEAHVKSTIWVQGGGGAEQGLGIRRSWKWRPCSCVISLLRLWSLSADSTKKQVKILLSSSCQLPYWENDIQKLANDVGNFNNSSFNWMFSGHPIPM